MQSPLSPLDRLRERRCSTLAGNVWADAQEALLQAQRVFASFSLHHLHFFERWSKALLQLEFLSAFVSLALWRVWSHGLLASGRLGSSSVGPRISRVTRVCAIEILMVVMVVVVSSRTSSASRIG